MSLDLDLVDKWAPIFAAIGSSQRLAILLILHGSMYMSPPGGALGKCLTFTEIKNVLGTASDATLSYHLQKLTEADLVEKQAAQDEKGRVFPLYSVSPKWIAFVKETGLAETFIDYIKKWKKT